MALYFVDYDLRKRKDYPELISELLRLGAVRHLKSAWSLTLDQTSCVGLRGHLQQFIDADDGLIVANVVDWAGMGLEGRPHNV